MNGRCRLAASSPGVSDPVWLAARVGLHPSRTLAATIVEKTERTMIFRFAAGAPRPSLTSGAPLLDRHGEVVGINIGGGRFEGRWYGHANPVESLRRHLATAS